MTDPEVIAHYRREAEQRRARLEEHRHLSAWIADFMGAAEERNHFGPDIDAAFHLGRKRP